MAPLRRISRAWRSTQDKSKRDRGAALVEFALVAPLFFFVVFAGIELGIMFRSYLTLEDASRNAARVASVERSNADADIEILRTVDRRLQNLNGDLNYVVIFNAETLASGLPASCEGVGDAPPLSNAQCNVYVEGDIEGLLDGTGTLPAGGFAPAGRTELTNVGIHIDYEYNYVTGFLDSLTLSSTSVEVVELNI